MFSLNQSEIKLIKPKFFKGVEYTQYSYSFFIRFTEPNFITKCLIPRNVDRLLFNYESNINEMGFSVDEFRNKLLLEKPNISLEIALSDELIDEYFEPGEPVLKLVMRSPNLFGLGLGKELINNIISLFASKGFRKLYVYQPLESKISYYTNNFGMTLEKPNYILLN